MTRASRRHPSRTGAFLLVGLAGALLSTTIDGAPSSAAPPASFSTPSARTPSAASGTPPVSLATPPARAAGAAAHLDTLVRNGGAGQADLGPGQTLPAGASLRLIGSYTLTMEGDGDLVARHGKQVIWENHVHSPGARLVMTCRGDLVEYSASSTPTWSVGPSGPGSCLISSITNGTSVVSYPDDVFGLWPLWTLAKCYYGRPGAPRVGVVGDSITLYAQGQIGQALAGSYSYQISGMSGFLIGGQMPAVQAMLDNPAGAPSDFIVNLGTNDALTHDKGWKASFSRMLDMIGRRCTVLVTVNQDMSLHPTSTATARRINQFIAAEAHQHAYIHVVGWNAALGSGDHRRRWLRADTIHPNAVGATALARLYQRALHQDC